MCVAEEPCGPNQRWQPCAGCQAVLSAQMWQVHVLNTTCDSRFVSTWIMRDGRSCAID